MYKSEEQFTIYLENKGFSFSYEPISFKLKHTTYQPDFYCPDNDTFYEVVGPRGEISEYKIREFLRLYSHLNFKIVKPNGDPWHPRKKFSKLGRPRKFDKSTFLTLRMETTLFEILSDYSKKKKMSMGDIVRRALKKYFKNKI